MCDSKRLVDEREGAAATFDGKGKSKRGDCGIESERSMTRRKKGNIRKRPGRAHIR